MESFAFDFTPCQRPEYYACQTLRTDATGGTFALTYSGQTTAAITFDPDADTLRTALLDLSNLATGMYLLKVQTGNNFTTRQLSLTT